jgi:hypothetical protein
MHRVFALVLLAAATGGCNAIVQGSKLSDVPVQGKAVFLSTGGSPKAYRTVGFIQVRGYGIEVAGFADVGDAQLDGTIKGTLADEAAEMGGQGVINIEFYDENPSTDLERVGRAAETAQSIAKGEGEIKTKNRYVTVSGEVIQFLE